MYKESQSGVGAKLRCLVGVLPGEVGVAATEVAVGCGVAIDRSQQVQVLHDGFRAQVEMFGDQRFDFCVTNFTGAKSFHHHRHRLGNADCIRDLHFAFFGKPGGDDIFGDISRCIRRRAIDFGRIFTGEWRRRRDAQSRRKYRR